MRPKNEAMVWNTAALDSPQLRCLQWVHETKHCTHRTAPRPRWSLLGFSWGNVCMKLRPLGDSPTPRLDHIVQSTLLQVLGWVLLRVAHVHSGRATWRCLFFILTWIHNRDGRIGRVRYWTHIGSCRQVLRRKTIAETYAFEGQWGPIVCGVKSINNIWSAASSRWWLRDICTFATFAHVNQ